jgi:hypothetical protein
MAFGLAMAPGFQGIGRGELNTQSVFQQVCIRRGFEPPELVQPGCRDRGARTANNLLTISTTPRAPKATNLILPPETVRQPQPHAILEKIYVERNRRY